MFLIYYYREEEHTHMHTDIHSLTRSVCWIESLLALATQFNKKQSVFYSVQGSS